MLFQQGVGRAQAPAFPHEGRQAAGKAPACSNVYMSGPQLVVQRGKRSCYKTWYPGLTAVVLQQLLAVTRNVCLGPVGPSHVHASRLPMQRQSNHRLHAMAVQEVQAPAQQRHLELPSVDKSSWENNANSGERMVTTMLIYSARLTWYSPQVYRLVMTLACRQ